VYFVLAVPVRRGIAHAAWISAATAVAGAVTAANRAGWIGLSHFAASPKAVADGRVWLLLTSGVVADRPWLASLLGFALVGFAALSLAGPRVVAVAALAGHVLATLLVYGFLGAAAAVDAGAFANLADRPDIGLSAIIAAWIGVVACALWRRHRSPLGHLMNALGCVGCALIGFAFRPEVTVLDSEHLVAFALGVAVAGSWPGVRGSRREASARSDTRGGGAPADPRRDGDPTAGHGDRRGLAPVGARVRNRLGSRLRPGPPRLRRLRRRLAADVRAPGW
jgi:hypothetical protein